MAAYTTRSSITAQLPEAFLVEGLDDDGDGVEDAGLLDEIIAGASDEVDSYLEGRYSLPLQSPPALLGQAALVFCLETLYFRRGFGEDDNPWVSRARELRARLKRIQSGEDSLEATVEQEGSAVTAVTEPARTHDSGGRLLA